MDDYERKREAQEMVDMLMMSSVEVPGNYFADWSSQSSVSSDILTGEWYHMTMGMMEWMWLARWIVALPLDGSSSNVNKSQCWRCY